MDGPTLTDLMKFTNQVYSGDDLAQAASVLSVVTSMASSYTRGKGWIDGLGPNEDVKSVILAATTRMLSNLIGAQSETFGPFSVNYGGSGFSWTVAEKYVLDRYRVRAV